MIAFYALIGLTFTQAHRILIEEPRHISGGAQFERLEAAHRLLGDLTGLASTAELNPVTIGRSALRDLAVVVPFASGQISIIDDGEEITVGTRGQPGPAAQATLFDIDLNRRHLGVLRLWLQPGDSSDSHRNTVEQAMRSVALAFDNVLLLQSIAHRAVREERVRVARELHDDIGPSLVSVGLGIDVAMHHGDIDPDTRRQLEITRETVGDLVDEIRTTVAHLRSTDATSLLDHAYAIAEDSPADGPSVVVDIHEMEVPVGLEAEHLAAIMTEAVRNAVEHSEAKVIRIRGTVGKDQGDLRISDDGRGIDPGLPVTNRYGLIGMQERADEIGARLSIDSGPRSGTIVTVVWGDT